jgi:hypothetical protein
VGGKGKVCTFGRVPLTFTIPDGFAAPELCWQTSQP